METMGIFSHAIFLHYYYILLYLIYTSKPGTVCYVLFNALLISVHIVWMMRINFFLLILVFDIAQYLYMSTSLFILFSLSYIDAIHFNRAISLL